MLRSRLRAYGSAPVIEFGGAWLRGNDLTDYVDRIDDLIGEAGVGERNEIALVVRNRPQHAAAIIGLLAQHRSFSLIYAFQSPTAIAADIEAMRPAVVIADREDWTAPVMTAAGRAGSIGIAVQSAGERAALLSELSGRGNARDTATPRQPAIGVLTSGTTGPPKRISLPIAALQRAVLSATALSPSNGNAAPELVFWPFAGIGGIAQLVGAIYSGKRLVLLEKFTVDDWVSAIKRYQMPYVGVQPAVVRMVLEARVPPDDLASLKFLFGGSGPLEPEARQLFEKTYGIPVLWAYGATEFAGTVLAWTPDLYAKFGHAKPAASGRPTAGTEVRIVDPSAGTPVPDGQQGLLEARVPLVNPDWIRTTDLASIDADGFVTLHGRADGAINRGGFKVLPETVVTALVDHPAVRDAAVVAVPDWRLGEVPFAAAELHPGTPAPSVDELKTHLRQRLPAHHIPVHVRIVDQLPRTPSLKVSLREVAALYDPDSGTPPQSASHTPTGGST
ncbi:ANL family adenylate-forming protein [Mycolicibacterium alvei]|nr:fatty acid--CoA ligase family protein [Mycolicibacterium alvei]MCV7001547.1 long-chain fatty acid--CoA ligase [Mycolicibacterium alvei]